MCVHACVRDCVLCACQKPKSCETNKLVRGGYEKEQHRGKLKDGVSSTEGERWKKWRKQEGLLGIKFPLDMICGYGDVIKPVMWK